MKPIAPAFLLIVTLTPSFCLSESAQDHWWQSRPEEKALQVNSGELELLPAPPTKPAHQHHNRITIKEDSLIDGWIGLEQCHTQLDTVSRSQILFREDRIRNLRITRADAIARAEVDGPSIQLWDVGKGARLCLEAESRALHLREDNYVLRNGPYMRRFLDGFYPMRVTLSVRWPAQLMELESVSPAPQPGLSVESAPGHVKVDTWFRGQLVTELGFAPR